jgi:hypothetical protein
LAWKLAAPEASEAALLANPFYLRDSFLVARSQQQLETRLLNCRESLADQLVFTGVGTSRDDVTASQAETFPNFLELAHRHGVTAVELQVGGYANSVFAHSHLQETLAIGLALSEDVAKGLRGLANLGEIARLGG